MRVISLYRYLLQLTDLEIKDDVAWGAVRLIVRHQKSPGFANARALELGYLDWRKRAFNSRDRSTREIAVEDVIGKEPNIESNRARAEVFADLDKLVGQEKVKAAFRSILKFAQSNYNADRAGEQVRSMPMHRMFLAILAHWKGETPLTLSPSLSLLIHSPIRISTEHGRLVCCA
jgi:hypothetical protein